MVRADLGIRGNRIVAIGDLSHAAARRTIDADDEIVAPGFIEMMGGDSYVLIEDPVSAGASSARAAPRFLWARAIRKPPRAIPRLN